MAAIKSRQQLPDIAKPTADLIERLGFQWELDFEYPVPDFRRRVQIRSEKHVAPQAMVVQYAAAMARGDKFAPVVVTNDGYLVDGATRSAAAQRNKYPAIQALVLDEPYENCTEKVEHRLRVLGAGFNARNGKGIDRQEIRRAVEAIGTDPTYDGTRIAALIGVTDSTVRSMLAEKRARERAEQAGLHPNGSMTATQLRKLGQISDKLNDAPFEAMFSLALDAGLKPGEISEITRQMREAKSDDGALRVVEEERQARRQQIAEYRASGKSKPPVAAQLRQRLGFILNHAGDPQALAERNPSLMKEHRSVLERAVEVLNATVVAQNTLLKEDT